MFARWATIAGDPALAISMLTIGEAKKLFSLRVDIGVDSGAVLAPMLLDKLELPTPEKKLEFADPVPALLFLLRRFFQIDDELFIPTPESRSAFALDFFV